jgi:broad specificity phosphatase PhoE
MGVTSGGGQQHIPDAQPGYAPSGSTRIYLARHGRTSLNAAGVLRGRLDPPLDAVGRQEAQRLAASLADQRIETVVASPLLRAVETARPSAALAGVNVSVDPRLIDRDYGPWAGRPKSEVEAAWGSLDRAPDVEPVAQVRARACEALRDLARRSQGQVALGVSHDAVLRVLLAAIDPALGDTDELVLQTGSFNTIDYLDGTWTVDAINQTTTAP